jgi:hypothetical protein
LRAPAAQESAHDDEPHPAESPLVAEIANAQSARHGVSAHELLERSGNLGRLDHRNLHAWLIDAGLAERNGAPDLLVPTEYGRELGSALLAVE